MRQPARALRRLAVAVLAGLAWLTPALGAPPAELSAAATLPNESDLWLAPAGSPGTNSTFARAVADLNDGRPSEAAAAFSKLTDGILGGYGRLYLGRAQLAQKRTDEAAQSARQVLVTQPSGYLGEAALWLLADASEAGNRWPDAARALQAITELKPSNPPLAFLRLGRAASKSDDPGTAVRAFNKVYYEFPLTKDADAAALELARFSTPATPAKLALELGRAERLFVGKRYADARAAFDRVRLRAAGDDRLLSDLRIAQCDVALKRFAVGLPALQAYLQRTSTRNVDARYYVLTALRGLGRLGEYLPQLDQFVATNATDPLAEAALNDLATFYVLRGDDEEAASVFLRMTRQFPTGTFADRATWKAGWWAYRAGDYATAIRLFEPAVGIFRRSDFRPSWLYWAARAHDELAQRDLAIAGFRQTIADYRNSYYGRSAQRELDRLLGGRAVSLVAAPAPRRDPALALVSSPPPTNVKLLEALLVAGLYDDALSELRRLQTESGSTPFIDATIAFALNRKGELRPAINTMRRAYPQFMADGGEALPRSILGVIFPVDHWDLIRKHAASYKLDLYLMAALIAQESTFQADVRSPANAWGLMQLLPSTARRYAAKIGVTPFSTAKLTDPETNIRLGMAYFSELLARFGDPADALAAYNAGENRVVRWRGERPGIDRDEFIDDIPFPETQNYVKRILGTAEDYRLLYGSTQLSAVRESPR